MAPWSERENTVALSIIKVAKTCKGNTVYLHCVGPACLIVPGSTAQISHIIGCHLQNGMRIVRLTLMS